MAQFLGLHRDGERLGLFPFNAEYNCRIWWQLIARVGRARRGLRPAKHQGAVPPRAGHAEAAQPGPFRPAPGYKGAAAVSTRLDAHALHAHQDRLVPDAAKPHRHEGRGARPGAAARRHADLLAAVQPIIPEQLFVCVCSRHVLRKMEFIMMQDWYADQPSADSSKLFTEANLAEAVDIVEAHELTTPRLLHQYFWANRAFPQNYVPTYILWRLCVQPDSPSVDRAWQVVDAWYTSVALKFTEGYDAKFGVIKALKSKAEAIRAQRKLAAASTVSSAGQSVASPYTVMHD